MLICNFWRNVYSSPLSSFPLVCFCCCQTVRAVYILDINPSSDIDLWIFFLFHELPFHFIDCVLWCIKVLNFDVAQFTCFFFFYLCFWCQNHEIIAKSNGIKFFPCVLCWEFYTFRSYKVFHFELFYILCKIKIQFHSFACGYPVFPITFVERLSFSYWMVLVPLSKIIWPYLWRSFCFIPLFYVPVFMALPPCFDYCSFVISVEIRKCETFNFFIILAICYLLRFHIKFRVDFSISAKSKNKNKIQTKH